MSDFEFLFALFGLLFGLIVAELSLKFADAIDSNRECPIGILTPALAFLLLTDVTSFWLLIWAARGSADSQLAVGILRRPLGNPLFRCSLACLPADEPQLAAP
jgi:hypothetical protein